MCHTMFYIVSITTNAARHVLQHVVKISFHSSFINMFKFRNMFLAHFAHQLLHRFLLNYYRNNKYCATCFPGKFVDGNEPRSHVILFYIKK